MEYSLVVPLKNEEENILSLVKEIQPVMDKMGQPWELICIDDGSDDGTLALLKKLSKEHSFLKILSFEKNFGQSSAFDAGFRHAHGKWVITLDGDLQNDPKDIPSLLSHHDTADLIAGVREKRQDKWHKKWISKIANAIRSRVCQDGAPDTGCSLKAYRRSCLDSIKMYEGMHRFLPALFLIEGFRVVYLPVHHRKRQKGTTKYSFLNRSFNTIWDLVTVLWMRRRRVHWKVKEKIG